MKGITIWVLIGALAGIVAASLIAPPMMAWYNATGYQSDGAQPAALVNIPKLMRHATSRLLEAQAIGGTIGAIVFLGLGLAFGRKRKASPVRVPQAP